MLGNHVKNDSNALSRPRACRSRVRIVYLSGLSFVRDALVGTLWGTHFHLTRGWVVYTHFFCLFHHIPLPCTSMYPLFFRCCKSSRPSVVLVTEINTHRDVSRRRAVPFRCVVLLAFLRLRPAGPHTSCHHYFTFPLVAAVRSLRGRRSSRRMARLVHTRRLYQAGIARPDRWEARALRSTHQGGDGGRCQEGV